MPLQAGNWTASIAGMPTQLQIKSVDQGGLVTGTIGSLTGQGYWDEDSQKLFLLCSFAGGPAQVFIAYLFTDSVNLTGVTGTVVFTLAGYVQDFTEQSLQIVGPTPSAKRPIFGWYAQIGVD
ncbi:MAG: hypothetical protein JO078_08530 [Candidatus Eremiobacteraeota bacterium]|nr:hypothetical protein [Candidatus Eremiobacteraeota bacterium]